ncbi:MAG: DUF1501 domain-containing protein [Deltaproteobacteria bacterium]|nr:DUF1501 domain-containing protein [Deltaproteobacteria bacterium]
MHRAVPARRRQPARDLRSQARQQDRWAHPCHRHGAGRRALRGVAAPAGRARRRPRDHPHAVGPGGQPRSRPLPHAHRSRAAGRRRPSRPGGDGLGAASRARAGRRGVDRSADPGAGFAGCSTRGAADPATPSVGPEPERLRALAPERSRTRAEVLDGLQQHFAHGRAHGPVDAHGEMLARAREIAGSPRRDAFDLDDESATTRDRYGRGRFGAGCLLARRLVDAEVPFIEVGLPGWDTHEDNFARTATLSAELDRGCAALLDDLRASGRLARTLVVCMGDFGRTPNINTRGGRDHWPRSSAVLLAGGGVRPGVIGSTSDDGREIATRPVSVPELYRTIAARLGIDADTQLMSPAGRPITLIDEAAPIAELLPS